MNSLDDLRSTLESHSHDAAGLDPVTRSSQLKGRIAAARRRRNAVRGGVAVAAVAAVASAVALPQLSSDDPERDLTAAARTVLGDVAPVKMSALGLTYEFEMQTANPSETSVTFEPEAEGDRPPLLTWTTADDDAEVTVTDVESGSVLWASQEGGFADHVVLDQWQGGPVSVTSSEPGVGAALYVLDEDAPVEGPTQDGVTFRQTAEGRELLTGAFSKGATTLSQRYAVTDNRVDVAFHCSGFTGEGLGVAITFEGDAGPVILGEACDDPTGPAGNGNYGITLDDDQLSGTVTLELTRSVEDKTPLAGRHPDLLLGLALYEPSRTRDFEGLISPETTEWAGHLWTVETERHTTPAQTLEEELDADVPHLVRGAVAGTFDVDDDLDEAGLRLDGKPVRLQGTTRSPDGVTFGHVVAPRGTTNAAVVPDSTSGTTGTQLLVYRLVE